MRTQGGEVSDVPYGQRILKRFSEELPATFMIRLVDLLEVEWQPELVQPRHSHDFWQIFYVINGGTEIRFGQGKTFFLRARDIALIEPGVEHEMAQGPERGCRVFDVKFDFSAPIEILPVLRGISGVIPDRVGLLRVIEHILEEVAEKRSGWKAEVIFSLLNLVVRVFRVLQERPGDANCRTRDSAVRLFDPYTERLAYMAKRYMDEHYHEDISCEDIAREISISPSYLSRIFQVYVGYSPREYLTHVRLENAKVLLGRADMPVHVIASQVGYGSPQYFTRVFKKHIGLSPAEYRKSCQHPQGTR